MKFGDSLRGYAFPVFKRDNFVCVYCGLDGKKWPNYLYFSWDHLLPPGHPSRDDPEYIVAACTFCNTLHNRTVFDVTGKTRDELVAQKKVLVISRRSEYERFWEEHVRGSGERAEGQARDARFRAALEHLLRLLHFRCPQRQG